MAGDPDAATNTESVVKAARIVQSFLVIMSGHSPARPDHFWRGPPLRVSMTTAHAAPGVWTLVQATALGCGDRVVLLTAASGAAAAGGQAALISSRIGAQRSASRTPA